MKQHWLNVALLISLTMAPLSAWANNNCQQADTLFKQSQKVAYNQQKSSLLKQATGLCPNHRDAHYQLAQLQKNAQQWAEAQWLYQHVIEIAPKFAPAYAELGDVLMIRKDYNLAAEMFEQFLTILAADNTTMGEQKIKEEYEKRLNKAQDQIIASYSTEQMIADLTTKKSSNKYGVAKFLDIPMRFKLGSHEIINKGSTWQQCQKIATSIQHIFEMNGHENSKIRIEGHTDDVNSEHYNDILSTKRANSVKEVLINDFKVPEERLEVLGMGENYPIAQNETRHGRFRNNRITLIKIDR